jgi:hypothetical protein
MSKRIVDFVEGAVNEANVFTPESVRTRHGKNEDQFDNLSPLARLDHSLEEIVFEGGEGKEVIVNEEEATNATGKKNEGQVQRKTVEKHEETDGLEILFRAMKRKKSQDVIIKDMANVLRKVAGENDWKLDDFMVLIAEETLNGEI